MRASIGRRLLILTTTMVFLISAAMAAFIWWKMDRSLRRDLDQMLRTEALALAGRLEADRGRLEFELETQNLAQAALQAEVWIQVIPDNRPILFTSPELKNFPGFSERIKQQSAAGTLEWFDAQIPSCPGLVRAVALRANAARDDDDASAPAAQANRLQAWIVVARPLRPLQETTRQLAWTLFIAVALSIIAAGCIGRYVAHLGTRHVKSLAAALAEVLPDRPQLNLKDADLPVELDPIVAKTRALLERIDGELCRQRQLTADIAHDVRTPITGVRTLLDVCLQRPRDNAEYRGTIAAALDGLRQSTRMLESILTLARLDAATERPNLCRIHLADIVADAIGNVWPLAMSRQIRIVFDKGAEFDIVSDRPKLLNSLTNIIANAVEYSPDESTVEIACEKNCERVKLHVRDQGPGVLPEDRSKIFERFYRADSARSGNGHNGLGLPIARGLLRLIGGDVYLAEVNGSGSDFVVELPCPQAHG